MDEIRLARRYSKPLICFGPASTFSSLSDDTLITAQISVVFAFIERHASKVL